MKTEENKIQNDEGTVITEDQVNTGMDHENESTKSPIHETRERLKALSIAVREAVKEGKFQTINEAIMATYYKDEENQVFQSYNQWHDVGFQVRKGEKAFPLWGRPKEHEEKEGQEKTNDESSVDDMHKFFPVAFLFSNKQVDPIEKKQEKDEVQELSDIRTAKSREPELIEK